MVGRIRPEAGDAHLSADRVYLYALSRSWNSKRSMLLFIGLNPSTADEARLDPTLRRLVTFATREGYGGFWVGNLFAFRATVPRVMKLQRHPVGPENDSWLTTMADRCGLIICGWGVHGDHLGRDMEVRRLLQGRHLHCLGTTKSGQPLHPLYLKTTTPLREFQSPFWRPE